MSAILGGSAVYGHDSNPYFSNRLMCRSSDCGASPLKIDYCPSSYRLPNVLTVGHQKLTPKHTIDGLGINNSVGDDAQPRQPLPHCAACDQTIFDQHLSWVGDQTLHESCTVCCVCSVQLNDVCFLSQKKNQLLCPKDYDRLYAIHCAHCGEPMRSHELFMRAPLSKFSSQSLSHNSDFPSELIFHLSCFVCSICQQPIGVGDPYTIDSQSKRLICRSDYLKKEQSGQDLLSTSTSSAPEFLMQDSGKNFAMVDQLSVQGHPLPCGSSRRIRTSLDDEQRRRLQQLFDQNPRPSKQVRESMASELGISVRVVQVWFQNQRARDKRTAGADLAHAQDLRRVDCQTQSEQVNTFSLNHQLSTSSMYAPSSSRTSVDSEGYPPSHYGYTMNASNFDSLDLPLQPIIDHPPLYLNHPCHPLTYGHNRDRNDSSLNWSALINQSDSFSNPNTQNVMNEAQLESSILANR